MLKTHKFNKRLKTQSKKERENTKSNLPLETSSSTGPLNTLTKINKTEEDLIFKSERKMPEEKNIYDIENKIDANEFNKNDNSDEFERENYISNRDISIPKKIVPTTDSVIIIQKEIKDQEREREESEIKEKERQKNQNTNNNDIIYTSQEFFFIIFISLIVIIGIFVIMFSYFLYTRKRNELYLSLKKII